MNFKQSRNYEITRLSVGPTYFSQFQFISPALVTLLGEFLKSVGREIFLNIFQRVIARVKLY